MKNAKKHISLLLSIFVSFSAFTPLVSAKAEITSEAANVANVGASTNACGENATWSFNNGTITISGTGDMYNYTEESPAPWSEISDIESVVIADGITSVGDYAFYRSSSLKNITFSETVETIGTSAFFRCGGIKSLVIPNSVKHIGNGAFYACYRIVSLNLGSSVETIDKYAFTTCTALKTLVLPDSVKTVGEEAFLGCDALESITFSNNLTSLGKSAFASCIALKAVSLPESVTYISDYAFSWCSSLESITFGSSVTTIGFHAFVDCTSLKSITLPDTVTSIDQQAFNGCTALLNVKLSSSLKSIGSNAFYECTSLSILEIPESITYICDSAFWKTSKNFKIEGKKGTYAESYAKRNKIPFIDNTLKNSPENDFYLNTAESTMPNITEKTTAETLIAILAEHGIAVVVTDKDGNNVSSNAYVGTGCIVSDNLGNKYTIIVKGDMDGSGEVDSTDYLKIKSAFLFSNVTDLLFLKAADTDNNGKIDSTDYMRVKSHFIGTYDLYK